MGRSNALEIRHVRVPKLKLFKGVRIAAARPRLARCWIKKTYIRVLLTSSPPSRSGSSRLILRNQLQRERERGGGDDGGQRDTEFRRRPRGRRFRQVLGGVFGNLHAVAVVVANACERSALRAFSEGQPEVGEDGFGPAVMRVLGDFP